MGMFSTSCMASGLPIGGQHTIVRFFALMECPYNDSHIVCEPNGLWVPLHIPIRGFYNNYGTIQCVEEGPITDSFFRVLSELAVESKNAGIGDIDVQKGMSQEAWLEALWLKRVRVIDPFEVYGWKQEVKRLGQSLSGAVELIEGFLPKEPPKVSEEPPKTFQATWTMIREDIWQALINITPEESRHRERRPPPLYPTDGLAPEGQEDAVAEYWRARESLNRLCRIWQPGHTSGPQDPDWGFQMKFYDYLSQHFGDDGLIN